MSRPTDWYVLDRSDDPAPGDPATIASVARRWGQVADDACSAKSQIESLLGDQAVLEWIGKAGDAFRTHSSKLPDQLGKCSDSYAQASSALSWWSGQLSGCQDHADRALVLGRAARADLAGAQSQLSSAQANASSAQSAVHANTVAAQQHASGGSVPKPDPSAVAAATARAGAANQAVSSAQSAVGDAQSRLDAAKRMAQDAHDLREQQGSTTAKRLGDAADAGIPPDSFWSKLGGALSHIWHAVVQIAKVVVAIGAIVALVVGGPIAWIVFAAAVIVLADTAVKYSQGKASLFDVGMAALGCIPGEGMLSEAGTAGKLAEEANSVRTVSKETSTVTRSLDEGGDVAGVARNDAPKYWNPVNGPGPLGESTAGTFRSATYVQRTTGTDEGVLYRAYGGKAGELGSYWTRTPIEGPLQARMDLALNPEWGNTASQVSRIRLPGGVEIFEGAAAPQTLSDGGELLGGGSQVFVPRVEPAWLEP